jgi:hypothetical protein
MATNPKEDERKFILGRIEVCHSVPALWNVNSKDYSKRIKKKNNTNICFANRERERDRDVDKNKLFKKLNSLRTNFRKELKRIKYSFFQFVA